MDFIKQSGSKLVATRLRQLSANFWQDRAQFYKEQGVKFKPNWGVVVMLIEAKPNLSINDISKELGFAHTSVLKIVKDMTAAGYICSTKDEKDSRRKVLSLTKEGIAEHKRNSQLKKCIEQVNEEILAETGLLKAIEKVEAKFNEASFYDRLNKAIAQE